MEETQYKLVHLSLSDKVKVINVMKEKQSQTDNIAQFQGNGCVVLSIEKFAGVVYKRTDHHQSINQNP